MLSGPKLFSVEDSPLAAHCAVYKGMQDHSMQFAFPFCHGLEFQDRLSGPSDRNCLTDTTEVSKSCHVGFVDVNTSVLSGSQAALCTVNLCRQSVFRDGTDVLYCSPNIVRVIKSKRLRWAGHVARMGGEERRTQGFGGET
jgi:hypothetical protein